MTTTTWTGTNGNWTDSTWTNGVPNATLDAIIDGTSSSPDTVTFNTPSGAAHSLSMSFATLAMAGGTLTLENSSSLSALNETGGLLDFAAGGFIGASLSQTAGTIEVASGTLVLEGASSSLAGTVSGSGELELFTSGTATLQSGLALTVADFLIGDGSAQLAANLSYAGGFTLGSSGTLLLSSDTFTASGTSTLNGLLDGPGTLLVSGTADANGLATHGTATIRDTGLITEDGNVFLAFASGTDLATLAIAAGATWDMLANVEIDESGTATITNAGLFEKTGGTGQGFVIANLTNTGTVSVTSGTLVLEGASSSLAGTVSGSGELELFTSGTATLQSGLALTVADFLIGDGSAQLAANLAYAGGLTLGSSGTLLLSSDTFTASGTSTLNGLLDGPGTLLVSGTADANGLATHGTATIKDTGLITEDGNVFLAFASGTDLATLAIAAGATWDMLANVEIDQSGTATIANTGLFEKTGGTGQGFVIANLTNTGTVSVTSGTLVLEGASSSLAGTVSGSGELELFTSGTATLQSGLALTVADFLIGDGSAQLAANLAYAGGFTLGSSGTLLLSGDTFTASGTSTLNGLLDGPGTLLVSGTADANGLATHGTATIKDTGLITEDGNVFLAFASGTDLATLAIAAGATWDMLANVEIDESGTATITNAGLFEKTGGTGQGFVVANLTNTGTVSVTSGTLVLEGASSSLGGTVSGSGELELFTSGTATLQSGLALTVADFLIGDGSAQLAANLAYAGGFTLGSSGTLLLSGDTFTASGTATTLNGLLDGPGTLLVSGTADANGLATHGNATIKDTGLITEDGNVFLAFASGTDLATLAIAAGATWDMLANVEIDESGTATITNAGLFEKTGGTGQGFVVANLTNTGTVSVTSGTLVLEGASSSLGGTVSGSGELELFTSGTATLQSGLALTVADFLIGDGSAQLAANLAYAGGFTLGSSGTLLLSGDTFTASGTATTLNGLLDGPGTLLVSGTADANGLATHSNATIKDTGLITEDGNVFLAFASGTDLATLAIAAGATWDMLANVEIDQSGTATITNAGLFEKTGGTGDGFVIANVSNSGTVSVTAGTLVFDGASFTNTGLIDAAGGDITFDPAVNNTNLSAGTLTGGTWEAAAGSTLAITGGSITTDAATIILSGAGSELSAGNGSTFTPIEQSLTAIAAHGALEILGSRGYTTANSITDSGQIQLSGGTFSDTGTLTIAAGGTFSGSGTLSAAAIKNSGSLIAAAGETLVVTGPVTGKGALVATGTLDLTGVGNIINAKILGPGLLEFSGGSTTIDAGVGGTIGKIDLLAGATLTMGLSAAYNGAFTDTATAGTSTLNLAGHKVSLGHASFTGTSGGTALIDGGGTLTSTGTMTLNGAALDGGTRLVNSDLVKQTGSLALGDASGGTASIVNNAGATYDITNAVSLSAASATADTIANAGLFEMTGSGTATIGAAFTNTGTIEVTSGTLEITAAFTNTGTIIGTEIQSNGTTFITAPSASVFNQYVAAMDTAGGSAALAPPPLHAASMPSLAAPHAA